MDLYTYRKKQISQHILVSFTSIGIANLCDYVICDRYDNNYGNKPPFVDYTYIHNLKENDTLFLNGFNIQRFQPIVKNIVHILKERNIKIIIYIGVIEPTLNPSIINDLCMVSKHIYITNNNHPKCHILPIGLRDGEEVHPNHLHFSGNHILNEMKEPCEKSNMCLLCFTTNTHPSRIACENILKDKSFVINLNKEPHWEKNLNLPHKRSIHCGNTPQCIFYKICHASFYTLCPRGAGEDTHRFYESIALHSIPIVKKTNTPFDKTFDFFPCLVVKEWNEVTEELLSIHLTEKTKEMNEFHSQYPNFLTDTDTIKHIIKNV